MAVDGRFQAAPSDGGKELGGCAGRHSSRFCSFDNRGCQGVFRALFRFRHQTQQLVGLPVANRDDIRQFGLALGDGTGFVEQHRAHRVDALQALSAFDQDTMLSAFSCANHDGSRGSQPQRAGAGDDQHGNSSYDGDNPGITGGGHTGCRRA